MICVCLRKAPIIFRPTNQQASLSLSLTRSLLLRIMKIDATLGALAN